MLPEGGCHLTLLRNGQVMDRSNVPSNGDSGILDWSANGCKILFVEAEQGEYGQPIAWNVRLSEVQSDSIPVTLFRTEDLILSTMCTKDRSITYLNLKDDSDLPILRLYDPSDGTNRALVSDVVS